MFSLRTSSFLVMMSMLLAIVSAIFTPSAAFAQSSDDEPRFCPINGEIQTFFTGLQADKQVEDTLYETITLENFSDYVLGGITVGVAVYDGEKEIIPAYWTTLSGQHLLSGEDSTQVLAEIDLSVLPAGDYFYSVVASQGDGVAALGKVLLEPQPRAALSKTTPQTSVIDTSIGVNGTIFNGSPISVNPTRSVSVSATVTNANETPLSEATLSLVLTNGLAPLGLAIGKNATKDLVAVANQSRSIELTHRAPLQIDSTAYAIIEKENSLMPLTYAAIDLAGSGDGEGGTLFPYVTKAGVSGFPLSASDSLVVCFGQIGADPFSVVPMQTFATTLSVSDNDKNLFEATYSNQDLTGDDYLAVTPNISSQSFVFSTAILGQTERGVTDDPEVVQSLQLDGMSTLQTVSQEYSCTTLDACDEEFSKVVSDYMHDETVQQSFWFYLGIVLAALLLMYLMLQRLDPQETAATEKAQTSPDELQ